MNIEDFNKKITQARFLDREFISNDEVPPLRFHENVVAAVKEHRNWAGMLSKREVLRNLVRARKFCRTVCP